MKSWGLRFGHVCQQWNMEREPLPPSSSSSLVPRTSISNIYHPSHPAPLHIITQKPRISISNIYHPWHPGPLHIIIPKPRISINLIFTIPGIQGLYISSSQNPESLYISNIYHPWHPGPLHIIIPNPESLHLIFTIPGIQGLYISPRLVPRIQ